MATTTSSKLPTTTIAQSLPDLCQLAVISQLSAQERISAHLLDSSWFYRVREASQSVESLFIALGVTDLSLVSCSIIAASIVQSNQTEGFKVFLDEENLPMFHLPKEHQDRPQLTKWNCLQSSPDKANLTTCTLLNILATFPGLRRLTFVGATYDIIGDIILILRLFQQLAHYKGGQMEVNLLDGGLLIPHTAKLGLPVRSAVCCLSRFPLASSSYFLPLVCTHFPNLTWLSLSFSTSLCLDLFPALATLHRLAHLAFRVKFHEDSILWPKFEALFGQLTPYQLPSVKTFSLNISLTLHSQLNWLTQTLSMPNLNSIHVEQIYCHYCWIDCSSVHVLTPEKAEDTRQCVRANLKTLYQNTGVPLGQISFSIQGYHGTASMLFEDQ